MSRLHIIYCPSLCFFIQHFSRLSLRASLDVRANHAPVGIQTIGQNENILIISSHFGPGLSNGTALLLKAGIRAGQILLSNVSATPDTKMLVGGGLLPRPADGNSRTWYLSGQIYDSGIPRNHTGGSGAGGFLDSFKAPAVATDIPLRGRPTFAEGSTPVNVRTCCGAKGDG